MSANKNNETLDEMIFEDRNKAYGAYQLRKNYPKYLTKALVIGAGVSLLVFLGAWGYNKYIVPNFVNDDLNSVEIDLSKLKEEKPEEEKLDVPPPPPEKAPPPPEIAEIKFLPPEPKADDEVKIEEPPPTIDEAKDKVISKENVEGEKATSDFTPPPPPAPEVTKPAEIEKPREEEIFTAVEQQPEFPGGVSEMYKYLSKNINYPAAAQRANVSGKVYVKFCVEKNGEISQVNVMKGVGFGCDEEAVRVVKSMPNWNPGKQNGKNVRVWFTLPVTYKLD